MDVPIAKHEVDHLLNLAATHNIPYTIGWNNFSKNLVLPNAIVFNIESIETLQTLIKEVYELNKAKPNDARILLRTAAGDGHSQYNVSFSFTQGSVADIIVRLVGSPFKKIAATIARISCKWVEVYKLVN